MLNEYIKQKETKMLAISNPSEQEKLKRSLMNVYVDRLTRRVVQYSLRSQLIALYYSVTKLLENFPNTRDNHFVFGQAYEKRGEKQMKTSQNMTEASSTQATNGGIAINDEANVDYLNPDARVFKKRPRKILSDDGKRVLNIWLVF